MLEGEGSIPVWDVGVFPLICDTVLSAGCRWFSPGTLVCSPSLRYLQNKKCIPNYVIAEQALHTTWFYNCVDVSV